MSDHLLSEVKRLREDFRHGGKLGLASTSRLLFIMEQMAEEIANLERRVNASPPVRHDPL